MSEYQDDAIEFLPDGVSNRPSAAEQERRERDAEPTEDESGMDASALATVARECGISAGEVSEILLSAVEHGLAMTPASARRLAISGEETKWRDLTAKLIKIMDYIKPPERPGSDEFDVLSTMKVKRYAALHAFGIPQFDAMNGFLNQEQFAATVKVLKLNYSKGKARRTEKPLTKAAVNKAVLEAQHHFMLEPRSDQREYETRDIQSAVRNGKLVKNV